KRTRPGASRQDIISRAFQAVAQGRTTFGDVFGRRSAVGVGDGVLGNRHGAKLLKSAFRASMNPPESARFPRRAHARPPFVEQGFNPLSEPPRRGRVLLRKRHRLRKEHLKWPKVSPPAAPVFPSEASPPWTRNVSAKSLARAAPASPARSAASPRTARSRPRPDARA